MPETRHKIKVRLPPPPMISSVSPRYPRPSSGMATAPTAFLDNAQNAYINLSRNLFESEEPVGAMRMIDELGKFDFGENIVVPRIILFGTAWSRRQGLLEELTNLPSFRREPRFPLEIAAFEDSKKYGTKFKIVVNQEQAYQLDEAEVEKFNSSGEFDRPISETEYEDKLLKASEILGVPPPSFRVDLAEKDITTQQIRSVSNHFVKIEMRGPDFRQWCIVTTPYLDTDTATSRHFSTKILMGELMKETRSIIVAVENLSEHSSKEVDIFQFAKKFDPSSKRTVGVLFYGLAEAQRDAVFKTATNIAQNEELCPIYGLHLIGYNAKYPETTYIPTSPSFVSGGKRALRTTLGKAVSDHVYSRIPGFIGMAREKLKAMRLDYDRYSEHSKAAMATKRFLLQSTTNEYCIWKDRYMDPGISTEKSENVTDLSGTLADCTRTHLQEALHQSGKKREFKSPADTADILSDSAASAMTTELSVESNIYTWIHELYQVEKAETVPGIVPYSLIESLLEEQTESWEQITTLFAAELWQNFRKAMTLCLRQACDDDFLRQSIENLLTERLEAKMDEFQISCQDEIDELLSGFTNHMVDGQFVKDVQEARVARLRSALDQSINNKNAFGASIFGKTGEQTLIDLMMSDRLVIYQIHDVIKAYYTLMESRYVEKVSKGLLSSTFINSVMDLCCAELFDAMSDEEVEALFKDSIINGNNSTLKARALLGDKIRDLEILIEDIEKEKFRKERSENMEASVEGLFQSFEDLSMSPWIEESTPDSGIQQ